MLRLFFISFWLLLSLPFLLSNDGNCPKNNQGFEGGCVARFLGRLSFEPLKENPLFGPSSNTNRNSQYEMSWFALSIVGV
ncbi:hypothetical protein E1A91_D11G008800v1 [Gossypium mustelinum]|uniref:Uncharacterized protein n=1 Tax=Gossypium mustelinum TaxID=34275 RepID=A0A5D2SKQ7_GOSMU|nr:hypothetical protein E1A91_D11G008800v1 [Gossypium mustelinum]